MADNPHPAKLRPAQSQIHTIKELGGMEESILGRGVPTACLAFLPSSKLVITHPIISLKIWNANRI